MSKILTEPIEKYGLSKENQPQTLFSKIGIVGCGVMGQKIAGMVSAKGIEVVFLEISDNKINEANKAIANNLDNQILQWEMTGSEKKAIISRIKGTTKYEDLAECDLVIEATLSDTKSKGEESRKDVFQKIENNVKPETIIATNSSTQLITELSANLKHKERCISLFFSAYPNAKIIQTARSLYTSDKVVEDVKKFIKMIGKQAVLVEESPGLISPRILVSLISEASNVFMEKTATKEDIDETMKSAFGLQLGPFELADKIGLDKIVRWMDNLYNEFGDKKYKAPPILRKLVRAKHYGRKTGAGFYNYDDKGQKLKSQ